MGFWVIIAGLGMGAGDGVVVTAEYANCSISLAVTGACNSSVSRITDTTIVITA